MFCENCGFKLKGDSKFCEQCGAKVNDGKAPASSDTVVKSAAPPPPPETRDETVLVGRGAPGPPSESKDETVLVGRGLPKGEEPPGDTVITPPRKPQEKDTVSSGEPLPSNFGRYNVVKELGRGAMGIVYLARDDQIGRNVAIKTMNPNPSLSPDERREVSQRFTREARIAGILTHPNIVTVYDAGEEEGTAWMAMEYMEGSPLSDVIAGGSVTIDEAAEIVSRILDALSYAHGRDVVHRDIKPDNIFLLTDGRVKVADFGIARVSSAGTMTQAGQVIGTPGYMSPEQVKGQTAGPESDIFSVGVLFYELLTGKKPFDSDSATSIMYKIVHEEPEPLHMHKRGIPPYMESVIKKATRKDPADRYRSAAGMRDDLLTRKSRVDSAAQNHDGTVLREAGANAAAEERGGTVLRTAPLADVTAPAPQAAPAKNKNRAGLIAAITTVSLVVLAGIIVLIVLLAGGDGGTEDKGLNGNKTTGDKTTGDKPQPPQAGLLDNRVAGVSASSSLTSTIKGGATLTYVPTNVKDNRNETCWSEGVSGYGEGQYLDFSFSEPVIITEVRAISGYDKVSEGKDRWVQNGKPSAVSILFSNGSSQNITFKKERSMQAVPVSSGGATTSARVAITGVYPGEGADAAADTSISELHFYGFTAASEDEYRRELEEYEKGSN